MMLVWHESAKGLLHNCGAADPVERRLAIGRAPPRVPGRGRAGDMDCRPVAGIVCFAPSVCGMVVLKFVSAECL